MFNPLNLYKYPWDSIRTTLQHYLFWIWMFGNCGWVWGLSERLSSLFSNDVSSISLRISVIFIALLTFIIWLLLGIQFLPDKTKS